MLIGTVMNGFGQAQPSTYVLGNQFKCSSTFCYGIGPVHAEFIAFQQMLNRYAGSRAAGYSTLKVDGIIGATTVNAAVGLARLRQRTVGTRLDPAWLHVIQNPRKEAVAAMVPVLLYIEQPVQAATPPAIATTTPPSPGSGIVQIQPTQPTPGVTSPPGTAPPPEVVTHVPTPPPATRPAAEKTKLIVIFAVTGGVLLLGGVIAWAALRSNEQERETRQRAFGPRRAA